jgi:hypothetical protein
MPSGSSAACLCCRFDFYEVGKRMTHPIIPWLGGKRRLADQLIPLFPELSSDADYVG